MTKDETSTEKTNRFTFNMDLITEHLLDSLVESTGYDKAHVIRLGLLCLSKTWLKKDQ